MARLTDQLRKAIDGSGMSRYAVAKAIGLDQSTLSRFMSGRAGLALDTVRGLERRPNIAEVRTRCRQFDNNDVGGGQIGLHESAPKVGG